MSQKEVVDIEKSSEKTIQRRLNSSYYKKTKLFPSQNGGGKGGQITKIALSCLTPSLQKRYVEKNDVSPLLLSVLAPEAAIEVANKYLPEMSFSAGAQKSDAWQGDTHISPNILHNEGVQKSSKIVQEALDVPRGWKKRTWIEAVAVKHDTTVSTIYRKIQKYQKGGLAGLKHSKPKQAKAWTPEAIDWWVGLCLKKEHRKLMKDGKKILYAILQEEANKRGWDIGGYESALWWLKKKITPQLLALQRGGVRALDNTLPPVLRNYSDLAPFEILVGDQHRFDFWVVDDDTGEVFRPEGYVWQDLRTRCFYGGAIDKKYDSQLMGVALRVGMKIFGAFSSIYTDHGKPEESKYIRSIMADIRSLNMSAGNVIDIPACTSIDIDPEEIHPCVIIPGTHRKAIVRNAKAKMIEGTFRRFEQLLRNVFLVPGYVKDLCASQEEQEVDQKEIQKLGNSGKLLTFSEFRMIFFKAMDYYNNKKAHRGVRKEWVWKPKPREATPMDCLKMCCQDGWQPTYLNDDTTDLIFLSRDERGVDRGRITFRNEQYEHDALIPLLLEKGEKVEIRYDPMDPEWLLVFCRGEYICRAELVEYSSMKDVGLAGRKIEEKARRRKECLLEYRQLTSKIPNFIQHSQTSPVEKAAALIGKDKKKRADEEHELYRERTSEELAAEVAELEAQAEKNKNEVRRKPLPARPTYFLDDLTRYTFCVEYEIAGGELRKDDYAFKTEYENRMTEGQREYWEMVRKYGTYQ